MYEKEVWCVGVRYSREESFMTFMIDIRNQHNLAESLEQFVKGDLLEGNNAYHCEKCNKKVLPISTLLICLPYSIST